MLPAPDRNTSAVGSTSTRTHTGPIEARAVSVAKVPGSVQNQVCALTTV